ncbi:LysR substrate-binding domain-containing protein [Hoeflea sp. YIM 152468]|uniref:LysR substrate-binding domain-containing protein n=1 Tax=Hoeflea sp. YIM 152468 TaxID=3031759 RepID=UPI0023D9D007|nr:LysR substrate-binding domain-containing protein [Hoeflea sp. YIM 152468]MDF1608471.1 LysR substrate-binding domain-containing protein [Hoeflea sp. YIM 152468]
MRFRNYDTLRTFNLVARHGSFASAADELHLTKGAISHQMRQLESELGFAVFRRLPRGIVLTQRGHELLAVSQSAFETVEQQIDDLRRRQTRALTIGVTTYFASRWLSPRLMQFMQLHPDIRLRIQPMIDLADLRGEGVDLAIRWGDGAWKDVVIEPLFACPAWPSGNRSALEAVEDQGFEAAFESFTLLHDRDDSQAWPGWFTVAGLSFRKRTDRLIIPDPNVRVQAVIDGQGVALNDALVTAELATGALCRLSPIELSDYGYFLAYGVRGESNPDIDIFAAWLRNCS